VGSTCHCPFHSTGHTHSLVSCSEQPARQDREAEEIFLLSSLQAVGNKAVFATGLNVFAWFFQGTPCATGLAMKILLYLACENPTKVPSALTCAALPAAAA
jgi:prepilin signal peptidase PulO-like enzyme (type II secretory pathway)